MSNPAAEMLGRLTAMHEEESADASVIVAMLALCAAALDVAERCEARGRWDSDVGTLALEIANDCRSALALASEAEKPEEGP